MLRHFYFPIHVQLERMIFFQEKASLLFILTGERRNEQKGLDESSLNGFILLNYVHIKTERNT